MKNRGALILSLFIGIILVTSLVLAQGTPGEALKDMGKAIFSFLQPLIEAAIGETPGGEYFFAKIIIFLITLSIIWSVLERIDFLSQNTWVMVIISAAVPILTLRFFGTPDWIETIVLPYSILGVAITTIIPLIIYFYFIEFIIPSRTWRKIAWIFAAVVFIGLFISRYYQMGTVKYVLGIHPGFIYVFAAAACIIFLWADGTIQNIWRRGQHESARELNETRIRATLTRERAELERDFSRGHITEADYQRLSRNLEARERRFGIR